jgi:plastocyanin
MPIFEQNRQQHFKSGGPTGPDTWLPSVRGGPLAGLQVLALTICLAIGFAVPALAEDMHVKIDNFVFTPDSLSVKAGTKIIFENEDDIPHSVVTTTNEFRSKALDTGENFSVTVTKPGTIDYFCGLHPHMKGKIVVTP